MARLRPWQQEEAHDSGCREVPAPIPAPSAATRLRAHPQLRISRQPATRHPPAALLPTAPRLREHNCFTDIAAHRSALSRYGTVPSAVEPCTSLNGSPRLNSCFALHLNPTSAQHEPPSASSASTRAPARTEISCLIGPEVLCHLFFQPMPNASVRRFPAPTRPQSGRSYPSQRAA